MTLMTIQEIKKAIEEKVFVVKKDKGIIDGNFHESVWFFAFRMALLEPEFLDSIATLFFEKMKKEVGVAQVCGLDVTATPIITGIIAKSLEEKLTMNGFFVKKSTRKSGLLTMTEGNMNDNPVVIVDNMINSGSNILGQVKLIEYLGKKVAAVYTIIRFHDPDYYVFLQERGIELYSIFTRDDFKDSPESIDKPAK